MLHIIIYIFVAIALDETSILVVVHFSMKNIYQSGDLGAGVLPSGSSETSVRQNLILNIRKTSLISVK